MERPTTQAETKRQRIDTSRSIPATCTTSTNLSYGSQPSEQLYASLLNGALWFLTVQEMTQILGTCRLLRQDQTLSVMSLSNSKVGVHLLHGCNGDWMNFSLQQQQPHSSSTPGIPDEESAFWVECKEHHHVPRKQELNQRLMETNSPLDYSRGQAVQLLSLIGEMETKLIPFYSRAYVVNPFGEFCRARPVIWPLSRPDKVVTGAWTMEDARVALDAMDDRLGYDFAAATTEYVHVSELGMHWENIVVGKNDAKNKCNFCDASKKVVREYRRKAKSLMDKFSQVLKSKQVQWRAEGLDEDDMHERRSELKAEMFPEDSYPDPNAAESTTDDILAHICENDKFPLVPFEGMASELERKNDDIFNALALECQDLCESFYQPLKQALTSAVAISGQRVHRSWMDTGEEAASIRRELVAGLSANGFLVGAHVMKSVEDLI